MKDGAAWLCLFRELSNMETKLGLKSSSMVIWSLGHILYSIQNCVVLQTPQIVKGITAMYISWRSYHEQHLSTGVTSRQHHASCFCLHAGIMYYDVTLDSYKLPPSLCSLNLCLQFNTITMSKIMSGPLHCNIALSYVIFLFDH